MSQYELIKDLEKKLSIYKYEGKKQEPKKSHSSYENIAKVLSASTLFPFSLSKKNVGKLLSGEISPLLKDGESQEINYAEFASLGVLEENFLARFVNDDLQLAWSPDPTDKFDDETRKMLNSLKFLRDIKLGWKLFEKPYLKLDKEKYKKLISERPDLGHEEWLKEEGTDYTLNLDVDDFEKVGTYFWVELCNQQGNDKPSRDLISEWLLKIDWAFDYDYCHYISFPNDYYKKLFLESALEFLSQEADLTSSWKDEVLKDIVENGERMGTFFQRNIRLNISLSIDGSNSPKNESHIEERAFSLDGIDILLPNEGSSPTELFKYVCDNKYLSHTSSIRSTLVSLIIILVENDEQLRPAANYCEKLLKESKLQPFIFMQIISPIRTNSCTFHMLKNKEYLVPATLQIFFDDRGPSGLLSNGDMNYDHKWKIAICEQTVDLFMSHLQVGEEQSDSNTFELLKKLAQDSFHQNKNLSVGRYAKDYLKIFLTELETQKFFKEIIETVSTRLLNEIEESPKVLGRFLADQFFLLFYFLEKLEQNHDLSKKVLKVIVDSYESIMKQKLDGHFSNFDEENPFLNFAWLHLFRNASTEVKNQLVNVISVDCIKPFNSVENITTPVRIHLRLLLKLFNDPSIRDNDTNNKLAKGITKITTSFGFDDDYGGFNSFKENQSNLWKEVCLNVNLFKKEELESFINSLLENKVPLLKLLELYSSLILPTAKKIVLTLINERNIEDEVIYSTTDLQQVAMLSLNADLREFADHFIAMGVEHSNVHFERSWEEIRFKSELRKIYENELLTTDKKIEALNAVKLKEIDQPVRVYGERSFHQQMEDEKDFYRAIILFKDRPEIAYQILDKLCQVNQSPLYLLNRFGLKLNILRENDSSSVEEYKAAWDSWKSGSNKTVELDLHGSVWGLEALLEIKDENLFNEHWKSIPENLKIDLNVVDLASKNLVSFGRIDEGQELLESVRSYYINDRKSTKRLAQSVKELNNHINITQVIKPSTVALAPTSPSTQELRFIWNEIQNFDHYRQSSIFADQVHLADSTHQNFLLDNTLDVCHELLERKQNLQIIAKQNSLVIEDLINDWFVSLLSEKVSYLNWSIHEQKRTGPSGSGKGVGEVDWLMKNSKNRGISVFEAFRLKSCCSTTIMDHLNKIGGYNSTGADTLFVPVYCNIQDFSNLCVNYIKLIKSTMFYEGFDESKVNKKVEEISNHSMNAKIKVYQEIQKMNSTDILIYHILIDLR